jgi:hypothetical protein
MMFLDFCRKHIHSLFIFRGLFRWLWPKIVQIGLDEFIDYFNNKKTRKQRGRILPSGVAPNVVFDMPSDYGLENLAIPVAQEAIDELHTLIDTSREEAIAGCQTNLMHLPVKCTFNWGAPNSRRYQAGLFSMQWHR